MKDWSIFTRSTGKRRRTRATSTGAKSSIARPTPADRSCSRSSAAAAGLSMSKLSVSSRVSDPSGSFSPSAPFARTGRAAGRAVAALRGSPRHRGPRRSGSRRATQANCATRLLDHPSADRHDETGVLRERNERRRRSSPREGCDQRSSASKPSIVPIGSCTRVDRAGAALDSIACRKSRSQLDALRGRVPHRRVEHAQRVAACLLRPVHGPCRRRRMRASASTEGSVHRSGHADACGCDDLDAECLNGI